jgi:hypothetical protein
MNDPHVKALIYAVKHSATFSYEKAEPCNGDRPEFRVSIEKETAIVEPKEHFDAEVEARSALEPYLRAWELDAALRHNDPDVLRFEWLRSCIIDRNPTPNTLYVPVLRNEPIAFEATLSVEFKAYPELPKDLAVKQHAVSAMFDRWSRYKTGQALLGDTADFCRGALEQGCGRQAAADRYSVERCVINTLGDLADRKGGPHARKYKGYSAPYFKDEIAWLEAAMRALIRRAAEVAHDFGAIRPPITMRDLPKLPDRETG